MSLFGALAEADRQGKEVVTGSTPVTTSVDVTTEFDTIDAVAISHNTGTSPGVESSVFTYNVDGSTVTIYAWKVTSSSDTTLTAGTAETDVSYIIIIGRRRR